MQCVGALVAACLVALTAGPQLRYGLWQDPAGLSSLAGLPVPHGLAGLLAVLHVVKVLAPLAAARCWGSGRIVTAVGLWLVVMLLATLSVSNTVSLLSLQRHERTAADALRLQQAAMLEAELRDLQAGLLIAGWEQPAGKIEAEIAAEHRSRHWDTTGHCRQVTTREQRRYCSDLDRLNGALAAAGAADAMRRRAGELREHLQRLALARDNQDETPATIRMRRFAGVS
jgi:hypothetical protein